MRDTTEVNLGVNVSSFKEASYSPRLVKPAYRGQKLGENERIRSVHDSFARRMDVLKRLEFVDIYS